MHRSLHGTRRRRPVDPARSVDPCGVATSDAGTITAGLFLEDFVDGVPFGHLDICGPMVTDTDDSWRSVGATAFGTRLLAVFAVNLGPPAA